MGLPAIIDMEVITMESSPVSSEIAPVAAGFSTTTLVCSVVGAAVGGIAAGFGLGYLWGRPKAAPAEAKTETKTNP